MRANLLGVLVAAGCGTDAALADELWIAIDGYESWGAAEGWPETPFESPHGFYVIRYDDPTLRGWDGVGEVPPDAISVKEEYEDAAGEVLEAITVMRKVEGYDPEHADWFWATFREDGRVVNAGKVPLCIGCHEAEATYLHEAPG